jgi:hypothetical protein
MAGTVWMAGTPGLMVALVGVVVYGYGWNTWSHSAVWNTTRFHIVVYDGNMAGSWNTRSCSFYDCKAGHTPSLMTGVLYG